MIYPKVREAAFLDRPNRFIAHVRLEDGIAEVHVKNTGRCRELLKPGARVILAEGTRPGRKTAYDLIGVYKDGNRLFNIDSQAPNAAAAEWLDAQGFDLVRREYTFGESRFDFYMEKGGERYLLEVKGCTLEVDNVGYFPDAPTQRGVKHLRELTAAAAKGWKCILAFVIQTEGVSRVLPNRETHPAFGQALDAAMAAGVRVLYLPCRVEENRLEIAGGPENRILTSDPGTCAAQRIMLQSGHDREEVP
jgi:sugar fermentation stimulation protein A